MAKLGHFDPAAIEDQERELLPPGLYLAQIIESGLQIIKSGNGEMLKLTFEVIDGPFAKRRAFANLNIIHTNAQAQEIAQRELKRICTAVGHVGVLNDSDALHFKPLRIRLAIEEDETGNYAPQNRVKGYEPATAALPNGGQEQSGIAQSDATDEVKALAHAQANNEGATPRPWKS